MPEKYWATCPDCGADIDYDFFNYEYFDENMVFFKGVGKCSKCRKMWRWEEKFALTSIQHFEEISIN
jgi:hypothetical protein